MEQATTMQQWMHSLDRAEAERLLDKGKLQVAMVNGRWWQARRNGSTQTWKRQPDRFRVPIKFGFKYYGEINQDNLRFFRPAPADGNMD